MSVDFSEVKEVRMVSSNSIEMMALMNKYLKEGTWIMLNVSSGAMPDGAPYQLFSIGRIK